MGGSNCPLCSTICLRRRFFHWRSGGARGTEYRGSWQSRGGRSSAEKVAVRLVSFAGLSPQVSESKGRKRSPRDAPLETATFHLKGVSRGGQIVALPFQGLIDGLFKPKKAYFIKSIDTFPDLFFLLIFHLSSPEKLSLSSFIFQGKTFWYNSTWGADTSQAVHHLRGEEWLRQHGGKTDDSNFLTALYPTWSGLRSER